MLLVQSVAHYSIDALTKREGGGGKRMMCSSHAKAPSHKNNKLFVAAKRSPKKAKGGEGEAREKFKKRAPNLTRGKDV